MSDKTVTALRKALSKKKSRKFEDGAVVSFISTNSRTGYDYTYAAIYIAAVDTWYLSGGGNFYVDGSMSSEDFIEFLARDGISFVCVATAWEAISE